MALTFKDVIDRFPELADAGFVADDQHQVITWQRVLLGRTERVRILYNNTIPYFFNIRHITASVEFHALEELFDLVMKKYPFPGNYLVHRGDTISTCVHAHDESKSGVLEKSIDNLDQLKKACVEVWQIMQRVALPFLEKYATLEAINEEADKRTIHELIGFIESPPHVRRLLIKKFCHDPGFEKYAEWIVQAGADSPQEVQDSNRNIIECVRAYTI